MTDLRRVPFEEAQVLADAMSAEMQVVYEDDEGASPASPEDFLPPFGTFLIGSADGVDVACGGLKLHAEGIGEVKRMYVVPEHRGNGHSRALLRGLIEHAREVGLAEVWLETGQRQPAAIALYESEGFTPIAPFGYWADHPETLCFALIL